MKLHNYAKWTWCSTQMHDENDYIYLPGHLTFEEIPAKYHATAWYYNGELIDLNWKGAEDIRNKLKTYYGY